MLGRKTLGPEKYAALLRDFRVMVEHLDVGEGEARIAAEYLLIVGHKPA